MKEEKIMDAINGIRDEYIYSAGEFMGLMEREKQSRAKGPRGWVKIVLIAAVIASLLSLPAYALTEYLLNSPEQALKQAIEEIERLNELGIIQAKVEPDAEVRRIDKLPGGELGESYFHRILYPHYQVGIAGEKYTFIAQLNMATGKLQLIRISAHADEDDELIYREEQSLPGGNKQILEYYDNTDDLVSPELTIGQLCQLLAEYWGFESYTLSGTENKDYNWDTAVPDEDSLVRDICDGPYITVYFEGDQEGVPMYIEIYRFSGYTSMSIGTNHAVG